ncbi:hypothetical protein [Amycolatopsis kentuckyensis]|uniref:hypothetical protein n=1 Tax=Amycolatopsis kentuckyensis TaxID=218823 RepID=UPI000A3A9D8C|nr:hypothetical protein [Amycolatopsis kentuckyensis]
MSEQLGWLISVKGRERMATRPQPYYAHTEAEKDWYLANSRQPEIYEVTRVPDPLTQEQRAELEAWVHRTRRAAAPNTSGGTTTSPERSSCILQKE